MSGWSSDVCSSDLIVSGATVLTGQNLNPSFQDSLVLERDTMITDLKGLSAHLAGLSATDTLSIASNKATFSPLASGSSLAVFQDRTRAGEGKRGAVRVVYGGRRTIKKKNNT